MCAETIFISAPKSSTEAETGISAFITIICSIMVLTRASGVKRTSIHQFGMLDVKRSKPSLNLKEPLNSLKGKQKPDKEDQQVQEETENLNPKISILQSITTHAKVKEIVSRESELNRLRSFITSKLESRTGGSMYISGAPGTGKTASIEYILEELKSNESFNVKYRVVQINAMNLRNANEVFDLMVQKLGIEKTVHKTSSDLIERELFKKKSEKIMTILVLDEMDGLITSSKQTLYKIFEWSKLDGSSLITVGIANALDLTQRFLPELKARNIIPEYLIYSSYTKDQIELILKSKIQGEQAKFEDSALKLIANKTASVNGDIRKALEMCRSALNLAISESENIQESADPLSTITVRFPHVAKSSGELLKSRHSAMIEGLPQHQQIVLCVAHKHLSCQSESTIGTLHDYYAQLSRRAHLPEVSSSDFFEIISALCTLGLLRIRKQGKNPRLHRIQLLAIGADIQRALSSASFYAQVYS
jgi:cell division control protein 6